MYQKKVVAVGAIDKDWIILRTADATIAVRR